MPSPDRGRRWLVAAVGLLWLPLVMAGGSLLLARAVAAPAFIAALGLGCVLLSLVLLWVGVAGLLRRRVWVADLLWLGAYGAGALLYAQLAHRLSP
jgi:hypothetical protein